MNPTNLTNKQLSELDSLFELVSQRQIKDFGNISASNKADGSLLTSCDLWSDKTIVDGLASIAPGEGVLGTWLCHLPGQQESCQQAAAIPFSLL